MRSPRPRSAGFVIIDIHSGEVKSELFAKREKAREFVRSFYRRAGIPLDALERFNDRDIKAAGLPTLAVHQVMLMPDEKFDPTKRR